MLYKPPCTNSYIFIFITFLLRSIKWFNTFNGDEWFHQSVVMLMLSPLFQVRDVVNTLTFACCGILDTKEQLDLFLSFTLSLFHKLYYAFLIISELRLK